MGLPQGYGWTSEDEPESCEYVAPAILGLLKKLGAKSVLDLGSGNGALCRQLAWAGYEVVGVEPDAAGIAIARERNPDIRFYQLTVHESPESVLGDRPEGFDCVVSTEVIEHLYSPRHLTRFAHSVLREGGYLIITTPYHGYAKNMALSLLDGWDRHFGPLREGGHIKFFSRRTIAHLLDGEGFSVLRISGVGRIPWLWKSMVVLGSKR